MTEIDIRTLNATLRQKQPFANSVAKDSYIWGKQNIIDFQDLNAHASNQILHALDDVATQEGVAHSLLIIAPDGTGKSHLIGRLRRQLLASHKGLFILANQFSEDLNNPRGHFQTFLVKSLQEKGSSNATQWQEIATAMTNDLLAKNNPNKKIRAVSYHDLLSRIKVAVSKDKNSTMSIYIDRLTKTYSRLYPDYDPYLVKAIFWTLSEENSPFAIRWLQGQELSEQQTKELQLPPSSQSFKTVVGILDIVSKYYNLLICFDELDNPDYSDMGHHVSVVVSNLVKDLFHKLNQGIILTTMHPGSWKEEVCKNLRGNIIDKLKSYCDPIELTYLDGDLTVKFVELLLAKFSEQENFILPHPLYPFQEDDLRRFGQREKPTARAVIRWCQKNWNSILTDGIPEIQSNIERVFKEELGNINDSDLESNQTVANALIHGINFCRNQVVENILIHEVAKLGNQDRDFMQFKIIGTEDGKQVCIGVAVQQVDGGTTLGATFKRLLDDKGQLGLTRGCLVRSPSKPMNKNFKTKYLDPLINEKGGEFVKLLLEEVRPIIAFYRTCTGEELRDDISSHDVMEFIQKKGAEYRIAEYNPLIREILSDPSYEVPDLVSEEDIELVESLTTEQLDDSEADLSTFFDDAEE